VCDACSVCKWSSGRVHTHSGSVQLSGCQTLVHWHARVCVSVCSVCEWWVPGEVAGTAVRRVHAGRYGSHQAAFPRRRRRVQPPSQVVASADQELQGWWAVSMLNLPELICLWGGSIAEWLSCWTRRWRTRVQIAVVKLSGNSIRQTVYTHCASVHQAAKLVAALLRVAEVTVGIAESNFSLPPGLWLTSPMTYVTYDSRHLQADCKEPGSAAEPYAR